MALNPNDPAMLLLYSLNESGATSTRSNSGQLTGQDQVPLTDSGYDADQANRVPGEGLPTVSDGNGGRAMTVNQNPDSHPTYTDEWRMTYAPIHSTNVGHAAQPVYPSTAVPGGGFMIGQRFMWTSPYTEGLSDEDYQIGFNYGQDVTNTGPYVALGYRAQDDTD